MQGVKDNNLELNSNMISKIKTYILPALALIGIFLSIELVIIYFNANFVSDAKPSFCAISDTIDCDAVARTQFSHFLGIPLALWGLGMYSLIFLLSILPIFSFRFLKDFKNSKSYIFVISFASVVVALILSAISATQIQKVCILCVITYLLNICIFVASKNGESILNHFKKTFKDLGIFWSKPIYTLLTILIIGIASAALYYSNSTNLFVAKSPYAKFINTSIKYESNGNILGARNPKVVIEEYTDFQCPFCAISHAMMERIVQEVPGALVIHHDFPLNNKCNPAVKHSVHKDSCTAALYSRAAKVQGKYWNLNNKLFDNQQDLSEKKILTLAKSIGLNTVKLKQDAHNPLARKQLLQEVKAADNLGITSTPTFFIGMKKYEGVMPYPEFKDLVISNMR